jgi:hypothetical protein
MIRPEWNGMRMPEGTIMLIGDQGFGDTLQFARFIPKVAERFKHVALACGGELQALLTQIPGVGSSFNRWQDAPQHNVWCRITSLGSIFDVTPETLPNAPYIHADPALVTVWAQRLSQSLPGGRKRVGIFWSGRPTHPNDRRRSLRLSHFAPLIAAAADAGVDLISLQKVVPESDRALLASTPGILDVSADLENFSITAAILKNIDMLVTIDSGICHLAGALGVPVTMMSPSPADWRWMSSGETTAWYPSMTILRQPAPGMWAPVIEAAAARVRALATPAAKPARAKAGAK